METSSATLTGEFSTRSLERALRPRAVAVVGASERPHSIGRVLFENTIGNGFCGAVYPVNTKRESILSHRAYRSVRDVPTPVDLAVIAVPAEQVASVIGDCGAAGVSGAVIISAGFRETGAEGAARERELLEAAQRARVRLIGPNCMGVIAPRIGLYATFASGRASDGTIGFASQSGALCSSILEWSEQAGVGFSYFLSVGAMADVGWAEVIYFLADDPNTTSILLYMESVGDARSFVSAAREVAPTKPIIVMKAGRTSVAAKAAASHTGAMSGADDALNAAFQRCGVLRVDTLEDLFAMAHVLSKRSRSRGRRVTVLTNAGGAGVIAADALIAGGGELAQLAPSTLARLDAALPAHWSHGNPVDILGDASPARFSEALDAVARDDASDGVLVIFAPQAVAPANEVARSVAAIAPSIDKLVIGCWMGGEPSHRGGAILEKAGIPVFAFPEAAAKVFDYLWRYSDNLGQLYETPERATEYDVNRRAATAVVDAALGNGRTLLSEVESKELLAAYGIPTVPTALAHDPDAAVALAERMGYPVAIKVHSHKITHKRAAGGVVLSVRDEPGVRRAFAEIEQAVGAHSGVDAFSGVTVQPMIERSGIELILGSVVDAQFGPLLAFGLGGSLVEAIGDRSVGLPPINSTLARMLIEPTRAFRALKKDCPASIAPLIELLTRFSALIIDQPRIRESDLNPLLASPAGVVALDARFVLYDDAALTAGLPIPAIRPYPAQYARPWSMRDGSGLVIRPIRPDDEPAIASFHGTLSTETVYFRYAHVLGYDARVKHENLARRCFIDYDREMALVAVRHDATGTDEILGVARLIKTHGNRDAELAIVVADAYQHQGLGAELVRRLIDIARDEGLASIVAFVLAANDPMQRLCESLGFVGEERDAGQAVRFILHLVK